MLVSAKIFLQFFVLTLLVPFSLFSQPKKFTFQRPKMGSPFIMTVFATDSIALLPVIDAAFKRVDSLNLIFSDYLSDSEINTLCKKTNVWQPVSSDLYQLLTISENAYEMSGGAFDRLLREKRTWGDFLQRGMWF